MKDKLPHPKDQPATVVTPGRGKRALRVSSTQARENPTQIEKVAFIGRKTQSALSDIQSKLTRNLTKKR